MGHHGDAPGHPGIEHHGGPENARKFFDDVAQLGVVHRQLPFFFCGSKRVMEQRNGQNDEKNHGAQSMRANEAVHGGDHSDWPDSGRR
ncbi:hypothetical protein D3C84_829250 [compost metagenome]